MNPITIQCTRCSTCLLLGSEIQSRIRGRSGRLPCNGCGEKIRLDGRGSTLEFVGARLIELATLELDEAPSARGEQLSLLPPPPDAYDEPAAGASHLTSLPPRLPMVHPPRPSGAPRPSFPSNPFDELGSLAPVVPLQGVRLTADGRLVNRADEAPSKRSRMRTWAPLAAAGLLATGFASARVSSMLPLGRSLPSGVNQSPSLVVGPAVIATRPPSSPAVGPSRLLAEETAAEAPDALPSRPASVEAALSQPARPRASEQADVEARLVQKAADEVPSSGTEPSDVAAGNTSVEPVTDGLQESDGPEFSREAALVALQHVAADAMGCRQPGDPSGSVRVIVTFAPSGRVTAANVGGVYAGTLTGGCIAGRFRAATVPAFVGSHVTVSKTLSIE